MSVFVCVFVSHNYVLAFSHKNRKLPSRNCDFSQSGSMSTTPICRKFDFFKEGRSFDKDMKKDND